MFHYRLILTDNRFRMLVALLGAILVHMGFLRFQFVHQPVKKPRVSLPRSVSVLLAQNSGMETTVIQQQELHVSEQEKETATINSMTKPVNTSSAPAVTAIPDSKVPAHPAILSKSIKEAEMPPIKDLSSLVRRMQPIQKSTPVDDQSHYGADKAAAIREQGNKAATPADREGEGSPKAGTVQIAYPRYEVNKPPIYPGLARKRGQEGRVVLQVLVNVNGGVDNLEVETSSGVGLLDRAALTAVRRWWFEPGRQGEKKVAMWVKVPIVFKLKR